jgi:hypothetical protein
MAIDTAEKRKAVIRLITPNSSKDEEWRREVTALYPFEESGSSSTANLTGNNDFNIGFSIGI